MSIWMIGGWVTVVTHMGWKKWILNYGCVHTSDHVWDMTIKGTVGLPVPIHSLIPYFFFFKLWRFWYQKLSEVESYLECFICGKSNAQNLCNSEKSVKNTREDVHTWKWENILTTIYKTIRYMIVFSNCWQTRYIIHLG